MTDERKDLPPVNSPNFLEKVREALGTYLGNRGSTLDRGITLRDLTESGLVTLRANFGRGSSNPIGGPGSLIIDAGGVYEPDLTPPPTPTGFIAAAAISNLLLECDPQTYTQGHGHAKSRLYGATWISGALPVFTDAVLLTEFSGTVASHATNPATTWRLWLTWVTVDGVESTSPAGGTNGQATRTGEDVSALVTAMTGAGNPFTILPMTTVIGGVTFPAGTYSTQAFIQDAQITTAKIGNAAIDDAKIASLSAAKLTIGDGTVGGDLKSATFSTTPGSEAGWKIQPDGTAVFNNAIVRGTVYATDGEFTGHISGSIITGSTIRTAETGQRIQLDSQGLLFLTGATPSGKYGSFKYGAQRYGAGVLVYFNNVGKKIPFYVQQEQNVADLHLFNRSANPSGPGEIGDIAVVNGKLMICTTNSTPGTWVAVGSQT